VESHHTHSWEAITNLPADWRVSLASPNTNALVRAWHEQAVELRTKDLYTNFLARLQRQWAIETGVLEGLYTLSEGATLALIEKGLDASLISHEDTNQEPTEVILKIQDHHTAIQGLHVFVSGQRPLGTSYVKELHQVLTAHQDTYVARDTLGNLVTRELPKGTWKLWPNNVEHADGTRFDYCPPEHVAQEMEHLISMHEIHVENGVPADVSAAWLHHRFTLIHPFADGNGRVARCLATLVLLRENWLPLVVTRKERSSYIDALRAADGGALKPLVDLFGGLQRKAIREAFSLSESVLDESTAIVSILQSVKEQFTRRRAAQNESVRRAFRTADSLQLLAAQRLAEIGAEVSETIVNESPGYRAFVYEAPRTDSARARFHYHQIVQCARSLGYFANLRRYQAWAALAVITEHRTEILLSFHGIGHEESGILGCAGMAYTKERGEDGESTIGPVSSLADEPFEYSYAEDPTEVQRRFGRWLDECVLRGVDYWRRSL
jgi:Fic family protein